MKHGFYLFCILMTLLLSSCDWFEDKNKEVKIGIMTDAQREKYLSMVKGAQLAVDDINARGGLLGHKLVLIPKDDKGDINEGLVIADDFSKMPGMLAVIGHIKSYVSLLVSNIYESANIIMLRPFSTSDGGVEKKQHYIFRMIPNSDMIGSQLAKYSKAQGYKNIIIFYSRNEYDLDLANAFESEARTLGINVVDRRSYVEQVADYSRLFDYWQRNYKFDALLLTGTDRDEANIINQIRQVGINVPILIGDQISAQDLIRVAGKNAEGIVGIDFADDEHFNTPQRQLFKESYTKAYSSLPDANALLGYDAILLLANAVKETNSLSNETVASYLHQKGFEGLVSNYQFDNEGKNLSFTKAYLKKMKEGSFILLDSP